jgi:hypothetical protein
MWRRFHRDRHRLESLCYRLKTNFASALIVSYFPSPVFDLPGFCLKLTADS